MTRNELLNELAENNAIGIQLLEPFVPEIDAEAHLYTEVIRRNRYDPSAEDAFIELHLLAPNALVLCKCVVTAFETVDVGRRVEIRRGSKESSVRAVPLSRVKMVEVTSSTGVYRGRNTEPDEPFVITIEFEENFTPAALVLPEQETLEGRRPEDIRASHESVMHFAQKLIARLGR